MKLPYLACITEASHLFKHLGNCWRIMTDVVGVAGDMVAIPKKCMYFVRSTEGTFMGEIYSLPFSFTEKTI